MPIGALSIALAPLQVYHNYKVMATKFL